jgi:hypothetical protein
MSGRRTFLVLCATAAGALLLTGAPSASEGGRLSARAGSAFAAGDVILTGRGVRWLRADGSLVKAIEPDSVATSSVAYRADGGPRPLYVVHEPLVTRNYDAEGTFIYFFVLDALADRTRAVALGTNGLGFLATNHGPFLNQIYGFREDPTRGSGAEFKSFFVVASEINDLEVGADGCSLFVATRTLGVFRFDVCTFRVLPALAEGLDVRRVRLLPDATALLVLGGQAAIRRIDGNGQTVREYSAPGVGGPWAGIDLAPDGRSFWAVTSTGVLYRFDLATGAIVQGPIQGAGSATDLAVVGAPLGAAPPPRGVVTSSVIDLDGVKPLTGETLAGYFPPRRAPEKVCAPASSRVEFGDSSGVAIGPYPGQFTARGSVTLGNQVGKRLGALGLPTGPVRALSASFSVKGGADITGNLTVSSGVASNIGSCSTFVNRTFPASPVFPADYVLSGYEWSLSGELVRYEAAIVRGGRRYMDAGRSYLFASRFFLLDSQGRDSGSGGRYAQYFVSDSIAVHDSFGRPDQKRKHSAGVPVKTQAIEIVTRWTGAANAFNVADFLLVESGAGDAARGKRATRPKVTFTRKRNSITAHVSGLKPGRLSFSVKAEKVRGRQTATTTVRKARPRSGKSAVLRLHARGSSSRGSVAVSSRSRSASTL